MKAAVLEKPNTIAIKDIPQFPLHADEVRVKVQACGICGSDLKYYKGGNPWALHTLGREIENPSNMVLGHEFAGEVVEVGSAAPKELLGKRVFVEPYNTCGRCEFCRKGKYNLCRDTRHIGHGSGWGRMEYYPGGMAEFCPVWATHAYVIPDIVPFEQATVLDPLAVAVHAVSISGFAPGNDALVMGVGPVGNCIAQTLHAFGAGKVFCVEKNDTALKIADAVGLDHLIDAKNVVLKNVLLDGTSGRGVDVAFDTTGDPLCWQNAVQALVPAGTFVNLVTNNKKLDFPMLDLSGERRLVTSSNNLYCDVLTGIKLIETGRVCSGELITHRLPLNKAREGFQLLYDKEETGAFKVVLIP